MSDTVVKTIENVDQLFSEIVVNGESHVSENYVPQAQSQIIPSQIPEETQSATPTPITQPTTEIGEDIHAVSINDVLHDFVDPETVQNLSQEVTARQNADGLLQQGINGLTGDVASINAKIPNQASAQNQLADKNFVNSSIATNTANFMGTFTSLTDIEAIPNPTNNDYAFLETTDSAGNTLYDRYKYNAEDDEWLFEYELNNSGFTAEQWATINSGLTQSSVNQDIADAIALLPIGEKRTISTSTSITATKDLILFVDTASITVTLSFGSTAQSKVEIYAMADCDITYYTDANTTVTLSMLAGTRATLIYFNGWILHGMYGAVWN